MEVNIQYKTAPPLAVLLQNSAPILVMWGYDVKILTNQVMFTSKKINLYIVVG